MQTPWLLLKDCPEPLSPCTNSTLAGSCHPHLFYSVSRKSLSHLGRTQPSGCSAGPEGVKILRLDRTHTWMCGAETKRAHFMGYWTVAGSRRGPAALPEAVPPGSLLSVPL